MNIFALSVIVVLVFAIIVFILMVFKEVAQPYIFKQIKEWLEIKKLYFKNKFTKSNDNTPDDKNPYRNSVKDINFKYPKYILIWESIINNDSWSITAAVFILSFSILAGVALGIGYIIKFLNIPILLAIIAIIVLIIAYFTTYKHYVTLKEKNETDRAS